MADNNKPKMIDVAQLAGVSKKTVSRVLNNEPHVQEALRVRVRKAVADLGYVPSQSARRLRGNKSYTICMIREHRNSPFANAIQFGALLACQDLDYQLSVVQIDALNQESPEGIMSKLGSLTSTQRPDGILLVTPLSSNPNIADALDQLDLPAARVGPVEIESTGAVVQINDYQAALEVTQHLLELGHRDIGFIRGLEEQVATQERFLGFCKAMTLAGHSVNDNWVRSGDFDFASGVEAAESLLSGSTRPTAIFAANDDMAAGVIFTANRMGLKVPEDISLVGFDDSEIAECTWPGLTTVRQCFRDLGREAMEALVDSLESGNPMPSEPIILPHEIIMRESTRSI